MLFLNTIGRPWSPHLTLLDFYFRYYKKIVFKEHHANIEDFQENIPLVIIIGRKKLC